MDFKTELERLIAQESEPLADVLTELAAGQSEMLAALNKKAGDVSLQVEEIYDMIKGNDEASETAKAAKKQETALLSGVIALYDLIESFLVFALQPSEPALPALMEQGRVMLAQADAILERCGVSRIGGIGEALNPKLHSVKAAVDAPDIPFEHVAGVLQSGYEYGGKVLRKATVVVSKGGNAQ